MFEQFEVPESLMTSDPRFGVGPSLIPEEHVKKLAQVSKAILGTSHRQKPVRDLCAEVQDGIREYFSLPSDYEVIIGNGGATFLFDMIGLGLVKEKSLHFTMGEFSQKWYKAHAAVPWVEATERSVEYGHVIIPKYEEGYDFVACTLNETSTGVMQTNLPEVPHDVLLAVDATSGAGQVFCDISKVDVYFFSPQKIFASEGGFYICILSPKAIKRAMEFASRNTYAPETMSWRNAIENSRKNQTYNTPSISTIFFLNEQLKRMNELGESSVVELANKKAELVYKWAEEKDYLSPYIKDKENRSTAVAAIDIDDKYSATDLQQMLIRTNSAIDIGAYRKLGRNQLRISLFHNISYDDLEKLTKIISLAIESEMKEK